jgi:hypothetical protein
MSPSKTKLPLIEEPHAGGAAEAKAGSKVTAVKSAQIRIRILSSGL